MRVSVWARSERLLAMMPVLRKAIRATQFCRVGDGEGEERGKKEVIEAESRRDRHVDGDAKIPSTPR
jgi:hypothetical protein